jgi:N-acetylornithine carbamoyltransferase
MEDGAVMDGSTQEHVRELAPVLARMCHFIGIRKSDLIASGAARGEAREGYAELARDEFMRRLAEHADVPVVNLESNRYHPLQGLADAATLVEKLGKPRGKKYVLTWAWHPKPLPAATPHSQLVAACDLGLDVTLLRPSGYGLDPEVVTAARARAEAQGGSLVETDDIQAPTRAPTSSAPRAGAPSTPTAASTRSSPPARRCGRLGSSTRPRWPARRAPGSCTASPCAAT